MMGNSIIAKLGWLRCLLLLLLALGVVYSCYYCINNYNYTVFNDPAARKADEWLRYADKFRFDKCKTMITDDATWFEYFKKDRESLGKLKSRYLKIKSERQPGSGVFTLYFDTQFEKNKLTEEVEIKESPKGKFSISRAKYIINNMFSSKWGIYDGNEIVELKKIAAECCRAMDSQDVNFFESMARESGRQSIYEYVNGLRKFNLMFGKPSKRDFQEAYYKKDVPGMAAYEFVSLRNRAFYTVNGKPALAYEQILLRRDVLSESKSWSVYFYNSGHPREVKPPEKKNTVKVVKQNETKPAVVNADKATPEKVKQQEAAPVTAVKVK
jgi:hypothetical protein